VPSPSQSNGQYRYGNQHLIELRRVVKTYQTAAGPFVALRGVDLQIDRGEFVAVVGKSGSGKSTLINMLTGIDRPTEGEVLVGDTAVHTLTVIENVMLPMDFCNLYTPRQRRERAFLLLDKSTCAITPTSCPQQSRTGSSALANNAPSLVADEPTGNLDSRTADAVFHLFETLVASGKTMVMVTHDTDLAQRAGRVVVVADGQIVHGGHETGTPGATWNSQRANLQPVNLPTSEPVTGATQPLSLDE
jgi:putative ABC transport system ATP-binding protein